MVPIKIQCKNCAAQIEVRTYRKFVHCPYCGTNMPFEGFEYQDIDWSASMYAHVKYWMDCPACRSRNMYLGPERKKWKCPDCGLVISAKEKKKGVFWFCDDCEAFLNVQPGFTTENGVWKCTECGYVSGVTEDNIL